MMDIYRMQFDGPCLALGTAEKEAKERARQTAEKRAWSLEVRPAEALEHHMLIHLMMNWPSA